MHFALCRSADINLHLFGKPEGQRRFRSVFLILHGEYIRAEFADVRMQNHQSIWQDVGETPPNPKHWRTYRKKDRLPYVNRLSVPA